MLCMLLGYNMSNIYLFLLLIDFILIGGILPLLERKFLSLIQRRVGPHYVGYKGRLQFLADALKVFLKDFIYLAKINSYYYLALPVLFFYSNLIIFFLFFYSQNTISFDYNYFLIYLYIILISSNILLFFSGLFSKNKYSVISSERILIFTFSLDFLFSIFVLILIAFSESFNIYNIKNLKYFGLCNVYFLLLLPLIILIFLIDANKAPYDLYEAESELVMGYSVEYSGFLFGVYVLVEYLHAFFFSFLIVNLIF